MGWWSKTILGGDGPMDCIADFEDAIEVDFDRDTSVEDVRDAINAHMKALVRIADDYGDEIAYQALGVFIITHGAKMPARVKADIVTACDEDEWAQRDPERKTYIRAFRKQIKAYPVGKNAKPRSVAVEGLFEALIEAIMKDQKGLINKR